MSRSFVRTFVLLALCATTAAPARAQGWTSEGAPVCTAAGQQSSVRAAADGAGGAFVAWSDQRPGASSSDVYLQHVGSDGLPVAGWPADGLALCTAAGAQIVYAAVPDGSGGVFVAWEDYRGGALSDVYGAHVLANGSLAAGWPADGLGISVFMEEQRDPHLVSDGAGGVFCAWADARTYGFSLRDVYAQHLHADGTPAAGWAANGMRVTNARSYDYQPSLAPDGSGGLYVTWTRDLAEQDIGAQHLGADGLPAPTWPDTGIVLCGALNNQNGAGVVTGRAGTAMAVWKDLRDYTLVDTFTSYYAVAFGPDTNRVAGWPQQGALAYTTLAGASAPFVASDTGGGLHFMWGELVGPTDEDLLTMHVDSLGLVVTSVQHPDGVVTVCPDTSYQHPVALVSDEAGGAYVSFDDYRDAGPSFANPDPYVQHVTAAAAIAPGWPATGVAFSKYGQAEGGTLAVPAMTGVIGVWARGSGAAADLYAGLVGLDGAVPALVSLVASEARPGFVRVTWAVRGAAGEAWRLERRVAGGEWTALATLLPDGEGRVTYEDAAVAPGARYGYRLAPLAGGAPLGETWLDVPRERAAFALRGAWPNPVRDGAQVRFALPDAGPATLALLDAQGRVHRTWALAGEPGERTFALDGLGAVPPGIYWLRLAQGERVASARVAILR